MLILSARAVLPMVGPPIEGGAVAIDGAKIVAVGDAQELARAGNAVVRHLGEVALMPGLMNAHCHLDYTMLRHAILPQRSFSAWVQRINALKRTMDAEDCLRSIASGFEECLQWGTTSVCTIESFPELMPRMQEPPIRTWWFYEMIDIRHRITSEEVVAGALAFFQRRVGSMAQFGLSPHAPFTASLELYHLANDCAQRFGMPLTTHLAESDEEFEMFTHASGPLYEFLASLHRPMNDCCGQTPFAHLWNSGAVNQHWILAHMNELHEADFALLERLPNTAKPTIVHCPGTHAYFQRPHFHWGRLQALGINLCVGTDSLASTDSLSLLAELRRLAASEPALSGEELLRTVTLNPARALHVEGQLGCLEPGATADLIAVPISSFQRAYDDVLEYNRTIPWVMVDGVVKRSTVGEPQ